MMQNNQTINRSSKLGRQLASVALAGAMLALTPWGAQAGKGRGHEKGGLVPYQGIVEGQLTLNGQLTVLDAPPASVWAHPFGPGQQVYDLDSMQVLPVFDEAGNLVGLVTSGTARTVIRNGDELRLEFSLESTFLSPTDLFYSGTYTILPGGTGRFEYENQDPGGLGSGEIEGIATLSVDPETGIYTMSFTHCFTGDLYLEGRGGCPSWPEMGW